MVKTFERTYGGGTMWGGTVPSRKVNYKLFASPTDLNCPKCVPFGSTVMFRNLPLEIRTKLNVGAEARAEMLSQDVDFHASRDDAFVFENKTTVYLSELPDGTELDVIPAAIELPAELPTQVIETDHQLVAVNAR